MKIGDRTIDADTAYVIAEAGVNHNGDLDMARELIDAAAEAGSDAVKFQTFNADRLVSADAEKAEYQKETTGETESQKEMLERYELSPADHRELLSHARERDVTFLSSAFDFESADLLNDLGLSAIKLGSGELTNHPLLRHIARFGRPMIVSTGMATMDEVEAAYGTIREANPDVDLALLHCTSSYPTAMADANLRAMERMEEAFPVTVGYSDHTTAVETPGFAVAAGARIVEKHFTLDRNLSGPDHEASLEPDELSKVVTLVRQAAVARGRSEKEPVEAELETKHVARKGLHVAAPIEPGETFTEENVATVRPEEGLSPTVYETVLGRTATRKLEAGEPIDVAAVAGDIE